MTIEELTSSQSEYKYHHTSLTRGYVSVLSKGEVIPYKGKFGEGYKVLWHSDVSTRYCNVSYYIKQGGAT